MKVKFLEYNGWTNYPTWAAFTHITDSPYIRLRYEDDVTHVRERLVYEMQSLFYTSHKGTFREMLMTDWIGCAISYVDWYAVLVLLKKELGLFGEITNLDKAALAFFTDWSHFRENSWQQVIADARGGEDTALREWVFNSVTSWIEIPDARSQATSPTSIFVKTCFDIVIDSIDWDKLTSALKGE